MTSLSITITEASGSTTPEASASIGVSTITNTIALRFVDADVFMVLPPIEEHDDAQL